MIQQAPTPIVGTPERVSPASSRLTREQVVDRILQLSVGSSAANLQAFSDRALGLYLRRLDAAQEPRGRRAVWVRPDDGSPAIVVGPRRA